jgi:chloramphenicol 3-O phosphotransferase
MQRGQIIILNGAPKPGIYDLEVDTSLLNPQQCADAIRQRLESGGPPSAFARIAQPSDS